MGILGISILNLVCLGFASSFWQAAVTGGWAPGAPCCPSWPSCLVYSKTPWLVLMLNNPELSAQVACALLSELPNMAQHWQPLLSAVLGKESDRTWGPLPPHHSGARGARISHPASCWCAHCNVMPDTFSPALHSGHGARFPSGMIHIACPHPPPSLKLREQFVTLISWFFEIIWWCGIAVFVKFHPVLWLWAT